MVCIIFDNKVQIRIFTTFIIGDLTLNPRQGLLQYYSTVQLTLEIKERFIFVVS
jgi:hypothetical protein